MKNEKTYVVKISCKDAKILDENFDSIMDYLIGLNTITRLYLIDETNVVDLHINTIVNKYISDCKLDANTRPLAVDGKKVGQFIINLLKYIQTAGNFYTPPEDTIAFDIINSKRQYFYVYIPNKYFSKDKYDDLFNLGPDYISAKLSGDIIFEYVLPAFYIFLFKNDLLDDPKSNNLSNYMIGLK